MLAILISCMMFIMALVMEVMPVQAVEAPMVSKNGAVYVAVETHPPSVTNLARPARDGLMGKLRDNFSIKDLK